MAEPADVAYALRCLAGRQADYALYRRYVEGIHRLAFASDAFRSTFGALFRTFAYNKCGAVIDAMTDRLSVTGWDTDGDETDDQAIEPAAAVWSRSRMDVKQGHLYEEAATSGDAYVIVWPGPDGLARLTPNPAHCCAVLEDDDDVPELAVKLWREERGAFAGHWRLTVYDPERIVRYVTAGKSDRPPTKVDNLRLYEDAPGGAEIINPYDTVPVFHFPNNAGMDGWGVSELRDVIPLQDALNKSILDQMVAGEILAFPQRWLIGYEPEIDPVTCKPTIPFEPGIDRLWMIANENAKAGQFEPTDMTGFISSEDSYELKIARVSKTPIHWLMSAGTAASGETLKTAEAPFVAKCKDRQRSFGAVWADAMALALLIDNAGGDGGKRLVPTWTNAEPRSEFDAWQIAQLKRAAGVPDEQVWAENGYTQDKIDEFTAAKAKRENAEADRLMRSFNAGALVGEEG